MSNKNYMALQLEKDGFKWASSLTVITGHTNVAAILKEDCVINALMCDTKSHCLELVRHWNRQYEKERTNRYA